MPRTTLASFAALALALLATTIHAQEAEPSTGTRRALIICGLTGDAPHHALFGQTMETIYAALATHHQFAAENVTILWSEPKSPNDGPALSASVAPATRDALIGQAAT